jgi:hypothetical protein
MGIVWSGRNDQSEEKKYMMHTKSAQNKKWCIMTVQKDFAKMVQYIHSLRSLPCSTRIASSQARSPESVRVRSLSDPIIFSLS